MIALYRHKPNGDYKHLYDIIPDIAADAVWDWCKENLAGEWYTFGAGTVVHLDVADDNDAVLVRLRFG